MPFQCFFANESRYVLYCPIRILLQESYDYLGKHDTPGVSEDKQGRNLEEVALSPSDRPTYTHIHLHTKNLYTSQMFPFLRVRTFLIFEEFSHLQNIVKIVNVSFKFLRRTKQILHMQPNPPSEMMGYFIWTLLFQNSLRLLAF